MGERFHVRPPLLIRKRVSTNGVKQECFTHVGERFYVRTPLLIRKRVSTNGVKQECFTTC